MDLPYAEAVAYPPRHHVLFFPNFAVKLFYESADDFPLFPGRTISLFNKQRGNKNEIKS